MVDDVSAWISAGSLVVAIIALITSVFASRKANATQQRLVEIEEQREEDRQKQKLSAELRAELRKKGNSYRLVIINEGDATARNVRVMMGGKPLSEHAVSGSNDGLPDVVGAHSEVSCLLAISMGNAPPFKVEVKWDDDSGNDREYRTTLTF